MLEIETVRLHLRQFVVDDLDELYRIYSNPEVTKYVGKGSKSKEETEEALLSMLEHWQQNGFGMWAVINKIDNRLIGRCGLCFMDNTLEVELGYLLNEFYWGQGLATEASLAALKFGFEVLKLERIVAVAMPENFASRHIMEKVGMKFEKNAHYYKNDVVYYSLLRQDFFALTR